MKSSFNWEKFTPNYTNTSTSTKAKSKMTSNGNLTYRLFQDEDIPGILLLWEKSSGWGGINEQQFHEWYINTPSGRSIIIIAANETGEIVGQTAFIPAEISLEGKVVKGLRISAPILHKDFRLTDLRNPIHPAFALIRKGFDLGREMGYHILYSLPAHGWIGLMKIMSDYGMPDCYFDEYDCVSVPLDDESIQEEKSNRRLVVSIPKSFNESYDELWKDASRLLSDTCCIIRKSAWLQWKISHHHVFEVSEDGRLLGYAVFKKKDGLLLDLFARNRNDFKTVLLASFKALHVKNPNRFPVSFDEIKLMLTPWVQTLIAGINYNPVKFQFAFGCSAIQKSVDPRSIQPQNWYIMPND
jgi:hypothetical protein